MARAEETGLRLTTGRVIGAHDLLIAATCLRLDCPLATLNREEFARVPGLVLTETARYSS